MESLATTQDQTAQNREGARGSDITNNVEAAKPLSIETDTLNLWYGDFQALIDVSVKVTDGLITGLIGPSGCGKSTLLRCFNRANERYGNVTTTGEIKVMGKNIYDPDVCLPELRKSIGMVFQRPNPLPISVYENIVFGLRIHNGYNNLALPGIDDLVEQALKHVFLCCYSLFCFGFDWLI